MYYCDSIIIGNVVTFIKSGIGARIAAGTTHDHDSRNCKEQLFSDLAVHWTVVF